MAASTRTTSGWLGKVRYTNLLKVSVRDDRFVVRVAGIDELVVMAGDITEIVRETGFADNWPILRIEHTAEDVPTPIVLFLKADHPVRLGIERLRPDVVTSPPESRFWRWGPRVLRLGWGLAIIVAMVVVGVVEDELATTVPIAGIALFFLVAGWSRKWY